MQDLAQHYSNRSQLNVLHRRKWINNDLDLEMDGLQERILTTTTKFLPEKKIKKNQTLGFHLYKSCKTILRIIYRYVYVFALYSCVCIAKIKKAMENINTQLEWNCGSLW